MVFINTGFLDRTGDEIHTSMEAAAVPRKSDLKKAVWLEAYERRNVDVGLACGLPGRAQIGKGMWAMPDLMADMLKTKIAHPLAGANTAWVPSPTAATLHALHYHQVDVSEVQGELGTGAARSLDDILTPPLVRAPQWSAADDRGGAQQQRAEHPGLRRALGRLRASAAPRCRITTTWRSWRIAPRCAFRASTSRTGCAMGSARRDQVLTALERMAAVVDRQNAGDPAYRPMAPDRGTTWPFKRRAI